MELFAMSANKFCPQYKEAMLFDEELLRWILNHTSEKHE